MVDRAGEDALARGFYEPHSIRRSKPDLMIIDSSGNDHHLPRRIQRMNSQQVNEFKRDIDREALPTIRQAQELQHQRKIDPA
jgi:hypothetical protein